MDNMRDSQKEAFQQQMMAQMQQMTAQMQQQGGAGGAPMETPYGGPGAAVPAGANAVTGGGAGGAPGNAPIEFNPYTGMPMAPAHQVLPQTVQPVAGPAPTPMTAEQLDQARQLQYGTVD